MTPRATGIGGEGISEAEVQRMIGKGINEYDDRVSRPRHLENLARLDEILRNVKEVSDWKTGWEAILKDRGNRGDHRRDWLAPILAAILSAAAAALLTLLFSKPMRSNLKDLLSASPVPSMAQDAEGPTP